MAMVFDQNDLSYLSMENGAEYYNVLKSNEKIETFSRLTVELNYLYRTVTDKDVMHVKLLALLDRLDLSTTEINKYTFFDFEKPYTRNLVATDNKNYTLLLLCWTPGKESKIHNHPCDGCYIKALRGCIRETLYSVHESSQEILKNKTRFYCEGQVSYMTDDIGLHKIGNPNHDMGSVSMHLYTPPFSSCKVWATDGVGSLNKFEIGAMGFFSVMGHRSPFLEGRPGVHSRLMLEIASYFKKKNEAKENELQFQEKKIRLN